LGYDIDRERIAERHKGWPPARLTPTIRGTMIGSTWRNDEHRS
jgi:hypothetical protein